MRLCIVGRHDSLLLAGLTFALLVIFQPSIQYGLEVATEIEQTHGVALVPALLILTVMFAFHVQANRREIKAEAAAAASEAALHRARAEELEHLMLFGQALARSLTTEAMRETVWRYLPALSERADVWVLVRTDSNWERLTDGSGSQWPLGQLETIADEVVRQPTARLSAPEGVEHGAQICFTMLTGARPVGMLGIESQRASLDVRRKMGAAAALLTVAVRNAQLFAEVRDHGLKDALTGCYNREHALDALSAELARAKRSQSPLSVVLFDVDHFKGINDRFGHLCGDAVLAAVGLRIRQILRRSDLRCRYGGDEFLVILPETGEAGAIRVAEWLHGEVSQIEINSSGQRVPITISVGVASSWHGEASAESLIECADRALYGAKAAGRNCVRLVSPRLRGAAQTSVAETRFGLIDALEGEDQLSSVTAHSSTPSPFTAVTSNSSRS